MVSLFRRLFLIAVSSLLVSCLSTGKNLPIETIDNSVIQDVNIAPIETALSFARIMVDNRFHLIAVEEFSSNRISGINLTLASNNQFEDPINAYIELGYDGLIQLINRSRSEFSISTQADQLVTPVGLLKNHIAVGTNYPAHAGETGVKDGPFLFPKIVTPTGPFETVSTHNGLLDYEVELAAVIIKPVKDGKLPNEFGLILSNDFTNRAALLRNIDIKNITSGKGFPQGKSARGFLPVGNLFVIPKNPKQFAKNIELKLYVNDNLRQKSNTNSMLWDFEKTVSEIWKKKEYNWDYNNTTVSLLNEKNEIPSRTLILSGTPHGVIFQGIPAGIKIKGVLSWLAGGWDKTLPQNVIEAYIKKSFKSKAYLQPNDTVTIHTHNLGVMENQVIDNSKGKIKVP